MSHTVKDEKQIKKSEIHTMKRLIMRKTFYVIVFFAFSVINIYAESLETINVPEGVMTVDSYTNKEVVMNGKTEIHLTSTTPLINSIIKLNSEDSWLYFDNIRPEKVISTYLSGIYINGMPASYRSNCRVAIYLNGAVVIPHASTFTPLTVYTDSNFGGESNSNYSQFSFNTSLGNFDNKISSFKLKKGYMATFATSSDGTGYSRVFIADSEDLNIAELPDLLNNKISFIRILQWEWPTKKGWCGSDYNEYSQLNATWRYDWSAGGNTTAAVEYVPIRQNAGWPSWSDINAKTYVSHVLGFNEPDHVEQSNVTVEAALAQWPNMMKTGLRIGSPACTDFSWLYAFMDSCKAKNYRVDYVAIHAYWGGKSPANWYNDLKYIHQKTGRPIWITEWNNGANWTSEWWPSDSIARLNKQLNDIKAIMQVLDTASFVERYSIYNWVQDKRAMVINGQLTPAGEYYASNPSQKAYNPAKEVIPGFVYQNPGMSVSFGTKTLALALNDPNWENFTGAVVERKIDDNDYEILYDSDDTSKKTFGDSLDLNIGNKIRYRIKSKFANGAYSNYTSPVGYDVTSGEAAIQYGKMSVANIGWNALFYKHEYTKSPAIVLGAATNANFSALLVPRAKIVSAKTRVNIQLAPWSYQNITSLSQEESVPYLVAAEGTYDFGGLQAQAARITAKSEWTAISFSTPFDTIPVVFAGQILAGTTYATSIRVRNISKTGFEVKIQQEESNTSTIAGETASYIAIEPGIGSIDGRKVIVGKTDDGYVGSVYKSIQYGDTFDNPIFLSQMQTCNDDVTAALRCVGVSGSFANVIKQRERSGGSSTVSAESVGWLAMSGDTSLSGIETPSSAEKISIYPNPARDIIYVKGVDNLQNVRMEIYNMLGVRMKQEVINSNRINVSELPAGYYIIRLDGKFTERFIKN